MPCELDEFWGLKGMKMLHLNARSLIKHKEEIHLNFLDGRTDVVTLTEMWLHSNASNFLVNNTTYKIIRHDRQVQGSKGRVNPGEGICVYVRSNLHTECYEDIDISDED